MIKSAEEFVALRNSTQKAEYDRAALDEASISVWMDVINIYPEYIKWVIHNKTVPIEILETIYDNYPDFRRFLSVKRKLSQRLFRELSQDFDPSVRIGVASNKKVPIEILKSLINDPDPNVSDVARYNLGRFPHELNR